MIETAAMVGPSDTIETILQGELAGGDAALASVSPVLRHLLASDDASMFGDEVIARVRGMAADLACQLLDALAGAGGEAERCDHPAAELSELTAALVDNGALLGHLHSAAIEYRLAVRLQQRLALDPVLPPLLQTLIASPDADTAARAMQLLAAQARFLQSAKRMQLPLCELPGDLLHAALVAMRTLAGPEPEADSKAARAEASVRAGHDEATSRLGLLARIVTGMGSNAGTALALTDAGVALFVTGLALGSGQDRDLAVLSTNEAQVARLALALRAAGAKPQAIEEQFLALHPDIALPEGFDRLGADRAAALLATSGT
jgi:hypothetical protein